MTRFCRTCSVQGWSIWEFVIMKITTHPAMQDTAKQRKARQVKKTMIRMKAKGRNRIKKRAGGIESRTERETERARVRKFSR